MTYPFAPMPSLGDFIQIARNHGAELHELDGAVMGPDGKSIPRYLTREVDGKNLHAVLPNTDDDAMLLPTTLRNLCDRLKIDKGEFGLTLTDEGIAQSDI